MLHNLLDFEGEYIPLLVSAFNKNPVHLILKVRAV